MTEYAAWIAGAAGEAGPTVSVVYHEASANSHVTVETSHAG